MFDADVYVKDGLIAQMGPNLSVPPGTRVIEAKGKLVMPGGIDTHTHMQLPFMGTFAVDDFYSGARIEVIHRKGAHEGKLHVGMRVYASRHHEFPLRLYHPGPGGDRQIGPHLRYEAVLHVDIGIEHLVVVDDPPILYQHPCTAPRTLCPPKGVGVGLLGS